MHRLLYSVCISTINDCGYQGLVRSRSFHSSDRGGCSCGGKGRCSRLLVHAGWFTAKSTERLRYQQMETLKEPRGLPRELRESHGEASQLESNSVCILSFVKRDLK